MPADRSTARRRSGRAVALATGLALAAAPTGAGAFAPPEAEPVAPEPVEAEAEAEPEPEPDDTAEPDEVEVEVEEAEDPTGGGMVGGVGRGVDANDPDAKRAQSDLEGESLDADKAGVPERLPKLQAAGWWLVFAGVSVAAGGGVLAGIAETREDDADRLAYGFSLSTGAANQFGLVEDEWNQTLREGQAFETAARGLIIGGGVVVLVGVGVFIADAVQRKRDRARHERPAVRVQPGPSGVLLRF